ncbi:putative transcriptional regulator [uncultured Desulfobacterium sp.]|uniref:Putative transcriptional regulator n=1 Tax=uncultured Desulfobacterium sp. TaxID=201089 RepID=A0A445MXM0_9BACT|nr:putative transcriptional regulator [uncultured Desulfobacterium sp.]
MTLGRLIKLVRTHRNKNQNEMAELLGISQNYLSLVESEKKQPSAELISKFAERLEISHDALIFAASDIPAELDADGRKDYKRLQNNILSLLLFEVTGELGKIEEVQS